VSSSVSKDAKVKKYDRVSMRGSLKDSLINFNDIGYNKRIKEAEALVKKCEAK